MSESTSQTTDAKEEEAEAQRKADQALKRAKDQAAFRAGTRILQQSRMTQSRSKPTNGIGQFPPAKPTNTNNLTDDQDMGNNVEIPHIDWNQKIVQMSPEQVAAWKVSLCLEMGCPHVVTEEDWMDNMEDITPYRLFRPPTESEKRQNALGSAECQAADIMVKRGLITRNEVTTAIRADPNFKLLVQPLRDYYEDIERLKTWWGDLPNLVQSIGTLINGRGGYQSKQDRALRAIGKTSKPIRPWSLFEYDEWTALFTVDWHKQNEMLHNDIEGNVIPADTDTINTTGKRLTDDLQQPAAKRQRTIRFDDDDDDDEDDEDIEDDEASKTMRYISKIAATLEDLKSKLENQLSGGRTPTQRPQSGMFKPRGPSYATRGQQQQPSGSTNQALFGAVRHPGQSAMTAFLGSKSHESFQQTMTTKPKTNSPTATPGELYSMSMASGGNRSLRELSAFTKPKADEAEV